MLNFHLAQFIFSRSECL